MTAIPYHVGWTDGWLTDGKGNQTRKVKALKVNPRIDQKKVKTFYNNIGDWLKDSLKYYLNKIDTKYKIQVSQNRSDPFSVEVMVWKLDSKTIALVRLLSIIGWDPLNGLVQFSKEEINQIDVVMNSFAFDFTKNRIPDIDNERVLRYELTLKNQARFLKHKFREEG